MTGEVIREMRDCPVPVIAAVHGMAAGAGAVIALAADFRVCTAGGRFAFLFTKVGLSGGDMGAAYLLPRLVGLGHATRLLMLGDTVDAEEAERIGLVSSWPRRTPSTTRSSPSPGGWPPARSRPSRRPRPC